ncbi:heme-dependent oxidative N-demethylase family protein [Roseobacter sp. CCS2]|uniref:heme-dependent oxidative N-demethylase family protein n=1 Tax=Roseobacter sp. CCS2 TaxID=391593 RepID=UPI0000F40034|nr:DUF3445 domain-containing protein [Roseobacter sp. CCS2]EBA13593.1 hypothetical protein RCCS2_06889 [Roseobacter sp. CCS2]
MPVILQGALPAAQSGNPRLPGTMPCGPNDWLRVDDAYRAQMAYRTQLLADRRDAVLRENKTVGQELLAETLKLLPDKGFKVAKDSVTCPDGRRVVLDWNAPLYTLGHVVQEDICLLEKRGDAHVLTGAVLCFPANWRLAEKMNQPLIGIHAPVPEYTENIARRVQRLFDGVKVGRPLWRFNKLGYGDADLHQPYKKTDTDKMPFVRSERQCILRLPRTDAVVFTIHTFVVRDRPQLLNVL